MPELHEYKLLFTSSLFLGAYKQCCLRTAESKVISPNDIQHIRKRYATLTAEQTSLIFELTNGYHYAISKQKYTEGCFYVRHTLEQTTSNRIAQYHASRFVGCNHVLELCTGSAGDTYELKKVAKHITTIESDALTCAIAEYNAHHLGITNITFINADAQEYVSELDMQHFDGLWADPARRTTERRVSKDANQYQPPLLWIMSLQLNGICGIKISPAITLPSLPTDWKREWIGFHSECREQLLWKHTDCSDGAVRLVDENVVWSPLRLATNTTVYHDVRKNPPAYIAEPHGALIRSGHLEEFYAAHALEFLDTTIAYGVTNEKIDSPFLDVFTVIAVSAYSQRKLQSMIHELQWNSRTEIKKRGLAQTPDEIRKNITFAASDTFGTVILTRIAGQPIMFLCKRV